MFDIETIPQSQSTGEIARDAWHEGYVLWEVTIEKIPPDKKWYLPKAAGGPTTEPFIESDLVEVLFGGGYISLSDFEVKGGGSVFLRCPVDIGRVGNVLYVRGMNVAGDNWHRIHPDVEPKLRPES